MLLTVDDYRRAARRRLPRILFDYLEGGAEDEHGLRRNRAAFRALGFRPRRLVDVGRRDLAADLFGHPARAPLVVAPTGMNALFWPDGDVALARAAARAGIPFVLSSAANRSIEEIAARCDGDRWFQLYVVHRALADRLVERARAADYSTLVVTVDVAVNGLRERDRRNGFGRAGRPGPRTLIDAALHPRWAAGFLRHPRPTLANLAEAAAADPAIQATLMRRAMDASFDWRALRELRDRWPRTLIVKGVLHEEDVAACRAIGVDGVVLSNHGGRQLDDALSPLTLLRALGAAAAGMPLLIDSGFRRGADVVKAVALGASGVMLGRALLYGLAARGEDGVAEVIALMRAEIDNVLAQIGCPSIGALSRDYLALESGQ